MIVGAILLENLWGIEVYADLSSEFMLWQKYDSDIQYNTKLGTQWRLNHWQNELDSLEEVCEERNRFS